ncbi:MAG: FAD:protein FMN transferase [Acidimicrobiales bacterium]|nr:FAD:protein FMN transferase [Acidimicrobiales bacterium]
MAAVEQWSTIHGLLGTVIEIRVRSVDQATAEAAIEAAVDEIEALERVFTVFDEDSDLNRWRRGELEPDGVLAAGLELAARWQARGRGAFEPGIGALVACWDRAAVADRLPSPAELGTAMAEMRRNAPDPHRPPPWNLNAIAKGFIVDLAVGQAVGLAGVLDVMVNAGGDICHFGEDSVLVGVEDPAAPFDNAEPLVTVEVRNAAIATSGGGRRGWEIGGQWYGHVLDPRTGQPVDHTVSASVLAPDAATADVVATICTVLPPPEAKTYVDELSDECAGDVACWIVDKDRTLHRSQRARRAEVLSAG